MNGEPHWRKTGWTGFLARDVGTGRDEIVRPEENYCNNAYLHFFQRISPQDQTAFFFLLFPEKHSD